MMIKIFYDNKPFLGGYLDVPKYYPRGNPVVGIFFRELDEFLGAFSRELREVVLSGRVSELDPKRAHSWVWDFYRKYARLHKCFLPRFPERVRNRILSSLDEEVFDVYDIFRRVEKFSSREDLEKLFDDLWASLIRAKFSEIVFCRKKGDFETLGDWERFLILGASRDTKVRARGPAMMSIISDDLENVVFRRKGNVLILVRDDFTLCKPYKPELESFSCFVSEKDQERLQRCFDELFSKEEGGFCVHNVLRWYSSEPPSSGLFVVPWDGRSIWLWDALSRKWGKVSFEGLRDFRLNDQPSNSFGSVIFTRRRNGKLKATFNEY